jgi:hypothetical protein
MKKIENLLAAKRKIEKAHERIVREGKERNVN